MSLYSHQRHITFECETSCKIPGVTLTQKSRRMLGARSCSSLVLPVGVTYSRYTVHNWERMNEWNSEHLQINVFSFE